MASSSGASDWDGGTGYYQQGQMSFNFPEQNHDVAYYQTDNWLSPSDESGDPAAFIPAGTGSAEYYHVSEGNGHSTQRSAPPGSY